MLPFPAAGSSRNAERIHTLSMQDIVFSNKEPMRLQSLVCVAKLHNCESRYPIQVPTPRPFEVTGQNEEIAAKWSPRLHRSYALRRQFHSIQLREMPPNTSSSGSNVLDLQPCSQQPLLHPTKTARGDDGDMQPPGPAPESSRPTETKIEEALCSAETRHVYRTARVS